MTQAIRNRAPATPVARARPRPRPGRVIDVTPDGPDTQTSDQRLHTLMAQWVSANTAKNEAARLEKKAKDALETAMVNDDRTEFRTKVGDTLYKADIAPRESDVVSIDKLVKEVDRDTFLTLISATTTAVKDKLGSALLAKVTETKVSKATIKVGKDKG